MKHLTLGILLLVICVFTTNGQAHAATTPTPPDFSCTGPVHAKVVAIWEQTTRPYVTKQLDDGLQRAGNVYVLYFMQEQLQSLAEMARRCKDTLLIGELATTLNPAFDSLRPLPYAPFTPAWICTDSHTCTAANKQFGREVELCSEQFLGLLGAISTSITELIPTSERTPDERLFIKNTANAIAIQVNHWLPPKRLANISDHLSMTPEDAQKKHINGFFVDKFLWIATLLSDLSELRAAGIPLNVDGQSALKQLKEKHEQLADIFNLFLKRTTFVSTANGQRAVIDQHYWSQYRDSRYALYEGTEAPLLCQKTAPGHWQKIIRVPAQPAYTDPDMGWDFSHARRLVPALDTFSRNRTNLAREFGYHNDSFDPAALQRAFANQIVDKIWNQNKDYPLFSNYWDGKNGWYRVGFDAGIGGCNTGLPPYGLTTSFPKGGYIQWGHFNPTIRQLGMRLYTLLDTNTAQANQFLTRYYPALGNSSKAPTAKQAISRMVFLATLVT